MLAELGAVWSGDISDNASPARIRILLVPFSAGYCWLYCNWQTWLPGFTGTKAQNWKSCSLPLIQVRGLGFPLIENAATQEFWAMFILITWQNSHFIEVISNLNSMLLHFYSSLNKTVNIRKCLYDYGSQSDPTSVSITRVHLFFSW